MFEGLKLAKEMGLEAIGVNLDSQIVVDIANDKNTSYHMERNLILHIRVMISQDLSVQVKHVYREVNYCVDALARRGINLPKPKCIFDICPRFISQLLENGHVGYVISYLFQSSLFSLGL